MFKSFPDGIFNPSTFKVEPNTIEVYEKLIESGQQGNIMKIRDTLTLYEELIAMGVPDNQAKIQAHQHGDVIDLLQKIEKDLFWMRAIGAGMIIACFGVMFK